MPNVSFQTFSANLRQMLPFHAFVLAHSAIVLAVAAWAGRLTFSAHVQYIQQFGPLYFLVLPVTLAVTKGILAVVQARRAPSAVPSAPLLIGELASTAVTLAMIVLFMGSFTTFKTLMPILAGGFSYDRIQADIDLFLHGGINPGVALASLFSNPLLLKALHWNYTVPWMALTFVPIFFIVLDAPRLRLRYCLSFVLVWTLIGNVLALAFLSAGPIFYADITGDAVRFHTQMQIIDAVQEPAFRSYLWEAFITGSVGLGTGISAFPSVHVAVATMNALFLYEYNRLAGLAGFVYVTVILVSSILLGWHYAIDGYVSIATVWLLHLALKWVFTGRRSNFLSGPVLSAP